MAFILWIVFGAIVGLVASWIMKTRGGLLLDIIVGIVGSIIGGFAVNVLGGAPASGISIYSFIVSVLGAVILLAIVKAASGRSVTA